MEGSVGRDGSQLLCLCEIGMCAVVCIWVVLYQSFVNDKER